MDMSTVVTASGSSGDFLRQPVTGSEIKLYDRAYEDWRIGLLGLCIRYENAFFLIDDGMNKQNIYDGVYCGWNIGSDVLIRRGHTFLRIGKDGSKCRVDVGECHNDWRVRFVRLYVRNRNEFFCIGKDGNKNKVYEGEYSVWGIEFPGLYIRYGNVFFLINGGRRKVYEGPWDDLRIGPLGLYIRLGNLFFHIDKNGHRRDICRIYGKVDDWAVRWTYLYFRSGNAFFRISDDGAVRKIYEGPWTQWRLGPLGLYVDCGDAILLIIAE